MELDEMERNEMKKELIRCRLNSVPNKALEILNKCEGRVIPKNIAHETGIRNQNVSSYLKDLQRIRAMKEVEPSVNDKRVKEYKISNDFKEIASEF